MLSIESKKRLEAAGWREGRDIDVAQYEAAYVSKGYPLNPHAIRFLREFGGLALVYPHFRDKAAMDGCNFRADEACAWDRPWLRAYEQHLGQCIVPVGHAFRDHMLLVMSEDGAVYACFEDTVCKVGEEGRLAINVLCEGKELECAEISEPIATPEDATSGAVLERLRFAGWSEGRSTDISAIVERLRQGGYELSGEAKQFLQEFGGLRIKTETGGEVDVNALVAMATLETSQVRELLARTGTDYITPLAVLYPGAITVVMGSNGTMFGMLAGIPDWLVKFGENGATGLAAMVLGVGAETVV